MLKNAEYKDISVKNTMLRELAMWAVRYFSGWNIKFSGSCLVGVEFFSYFECKTFDSGLSVFFMWTIIFEQAFILVLIY